jgi:drug/metabolite transporter (DMT)-like permease
MEKQTFIFGKRNYILMIAGIVLMVIGYLLMAGGGSDNPEVFNPEIFSFQRIGLAPILVVGGLLLEVYAIMTRK